MTSLLISVAVIVLVAIYAYWNVTRKTNQMARALRSWRERQENFKQGDWVEVEVEWTGSRRPGMASTSAIGPDEDAAVFEALFYAQWSFGTRAGQITRLNHQVIRRKGEVAATSAKESEASEAPTVDLESKNLVGAQLSRRVLRDRDFSGADLREAQLDWCDLAGANLSHANLSHANLNGAYLLGGANLSHANLSHANLNDSALGGANLSHANLSHANLNGAYLGEADLSHSDLSFANLGAHFSYKQRWDARRNPNLYQRMGVDTSNRVNGPNLTEADLTGCSRILESLVRCDSTVEGVIIPETRLEHAQMVGVRLRGANLQRSIILWSDLSEADLRAVDLSAAEIRGGKLNRANLEGINLADAELDDMQMVGCNLRGADLRRTEIWNCKLSEIDLTGADLTGAKLRTEFGPIVYDESTIWPEEFRPPPSADSTVS